MWVPSGISLWARIYCIYCTYVKGETANYIFETVPVLCVHQYSKPATMTHLVNGVTAKCSSFQNILKVLQLNLSSQWFPLIKMEFHCVYME